MSRNSNNEQEPLLPFGEPEVDTETQEGPDKSQNWLIAKKLWVAQFFVTLHAKSATIVGAVMTNAFIVEVRVVQNSLLLRA